MEVAAGADLTTYLALKTRLPTQMGLDSDDPRARGEVGKVGVAIDSIADMRTRMLSRVTLNTM